MDITLASIVVRTRGLASTPLDSDIVVLNPARNNYVWLDPVGRRIWELLDKPLSVSEVVLLLSAEFGGERQQIVADLIGFLNELRSESLVELRESESATEISPSKCTGTLPSV